LQEAFAHLSAEAALETLLKQLDTNDELPLTAEAAAACFQVAAAITAVRHYDSLWQVGSWWAKRRIERQLKEKGETMQKQLMIRNKLYRQWQNLIRQLKSEASWVIADLTQAVDRREGDFYEQIETSPDLEEFYIHWAEESWFKVGDTVNPTCPGWLGRYHRLMSEPELYGYVRQLIRLLSLTVEDSFEVSPVNTDEDEPELAVAESAKVLCRLEGLLRQGLYLGQAKKSNSSRVNQNASRVWSLYRKLNQGIVSLSQQAEAKQLPSEGWIAWWQKVAAWSIPFSHPPKKPGFWSRLVGGRKLLPVQQTAAPECWINALESRLEEESCYLVCKSYQKKIESIEMDYQAQEEKASIETHYLLVKERFELFKQRLSYLVTLGILGEDEPVLDQLALEFDELSARSAAVKGAILAYWECRGVNQDLEESSFEIIKESRRSKGKEKIETPEPAPEIWIQLGKEGEFYCQELGLKPDGEGKIAWSVVKKTYHQLARKTHTDKNPDASPEAFQKINRAYQLIEGLKNGDKAVGSYKEDGQASEAEEERVREEWAEIRRDMEELAAGWQAVSRRYDALEATGKAIAEEQERISQSFQKIRNVFQETTELHQKTRELHQDVRIEFERISQSNAELRRDQQEMTERLQQIKEKRALKRRRNKAEKQSQSGPEFWQTREVLTPENNNDTPSPLADESERETSSLEQASGKNI
jgi:uncharacterized protein YoxC